MAKNEKICITTSRGSPMKGSCVQYVAESVEHLVRVRGWVGWANAVEQGEREREREGRLREEGDIEVGTN